MLCHTLMLSFCVDLLWERFEAPAPAPIEYFTTRPGRARVVSPTGGVLFWYKCLGLKNAFVKDETTQEVPIYGVYQAKGSLRMSQDGCIGSHTGPIG